MRRCEFCTETAGYVYATTGTPLCRWHLVIFYLGLCMVDRRYA